MESGLAASISARWPCFDCNLESCAGVTEPARERLVSRECQFEPREKRPVVVMDCDEAAGSDNANLPCRQNLCCTSGATTAREVFVGQAVFTRSGASALVESRKCNANKQQTIRRG